jgi:hypothetical protein
MTLRFILGIVDGEGHHIREALTKTHIEEPMSAACLITPEDWYKNNSDQTNRIAVPCAAQ